MEEINFNFILSELGLQKKVTCKSPNFNFWNNEDYIQYTSKKYYNSELKEQDEFYDIFESVLLHKKSGVRIKYISHESYFGDEVDYTLISFFILNNNGEEFELESVDFANGIYYTIDKTIMITDVNLKHNQNQ
jgi:hypothetical protein